VIKDISEQSVVTLQFNRPLVIPGLYSNISDLSKDPRYVQTIQEVLKVWTKSGIDTDGDDETRVALVAYNLTYWSGAQIKLLLQFKNPYKISLNTILY